MQMDNMLCGQPRSHVDRVSQRDGLKGKYEIGIQMET